MAGLTPARAFDLEAEIISQRAGQLRTWVPLACSLHTFHTGEGWRLRACASFNEWLGQPEVAIGRAEAYAHIAAWRDLVLERGVAPQELAVLDPSKVAVVLPAIKAGACLEDALSDCLVLSRSDLREKYRQGGEVEYRVCEACGSRIKAAL